MTRPATNEILHTSGRVLRFICFLLKSCSWPLCQKRVPHSIAKEKTPITTLAQYVNRNENFVLVYGIVVSWSWPLCSAFAFRARAYRRSGLSGLSSVPAGRQVAPGGAWDIYAPYCYRHAASTKLSV